MNILRIITLTAALLAGAACFFAPQARAGSCCGGGGTAAFVLPKTLRGMVDMSAEREI